MSFIDKLKRIFENKEEKQEKNKEKEQKEKISLKELSSKLDEKISQDLIKEKQVKKEISDRINSLETQLKEAIAILEQKDLSERKEKEKVKEIVKDNVQVYISHLNKFVIDLKKIDAFHLKKYLDKLFEIINEFHKLSYKPFEKATILIGKELENIKNIVKAFTKEIITINNSNKNIFEKNSLKNELKDTIQELYQDNAFLEELDIKLKGLYEKLEFKKQENETIIKKIDETRKSENYKKDLDEKEKHKEQLNKLEKEIREIKQKIDFKLLKKYSYNDQKKTKIVQEYSDNFKETIKKDQNLEIINLAKEAQNLELGELKELKTKIIEFDKPLITKTDQELDSLEYGSRKLDSEITNIKLEIDNESKKKERLSNKRDKIKDNMKKLAKDIFNDVEIE